MAGLTVTVTREEADLRELPWAVSVVEAEALGETGRGLSLAEGLDGIPGVFVQDRRNYSLGDRITVRGTGARAQFGVRGIRVLLDGIPLTFPDGQTSLTNLDPATLGRAEVVRGPAAALYGNAAGGVLAFRTREPAAVPLRAGPRVLAGSHGLFEMRLEGSGSSGPWGWTAAGSRMVTDGFREHSAAETWRANLVGGRELAGGGHLRGVLNVYHSPFAENPSSLSAEDARERPRFAREFVVSQGAGEETTQAQGGAAARVPLGGDAVIDVVGWGLGREVWNPIPGRIIDLGRLAGGVRAEAAGRSGPVSWVAGADLEAQRDDRVERENLGVPETGGRAREGETLIDQRETVVGVGPFLQAGLELGGGWRVTAATRLDVYRFAADDARRIDGDDSGSRTFSRASPMAGVSWSPERAWSVYASYGTAFQTPTASELSNQPDGSGGFNRELDPERIASLEVGARFLPPGGTWALEAAGWRAVVEGALVPFQGPDEEVFFRNAARSERLGLETRLEWRPAVGVRARASWTWQRARFDEFVTPEGDFSGNREPGVPEHVADVEAAWRAPFGLRTEVGLRWTDAFAVDDANGAFNSSYRVVDLLLSWRSPGAVIRPFLGIDNLSDERYNGSVVPNAFGGRFYEPAPGREAFAGLSLRLPAVSRGSGR